MATRVSFVPVVVEIIDVPVTVVGPGIVIDLGQPPADEVLNLLASVFPCGSTPISQERDSLATPRHAPQVICTVVGIQAAFVPFDDNPAPSCIMSPLPRKVAEWKRQRYPGQFKGMKGPRKR